MSSPEKALDKALASAPPAVVEALGGAPVPVPARPGQRPGRTDGAAVPHTPGLRRQPVERPEGIPVVERVANPLFDAPNPRIEKARRGVASIRSAFGTVAAAMQTAIALAEGVGTTYGDTYKEAAALEGFDLKAADKVLAEFQAFLDRHKPKAPEAGTAAS